MLPGSVFVVDVDDHEDNGDRLQHLQREDSEAFPDYLEECNYDDGEVEEGELL